MSRNLEGLQALRFVGAALVVVHHSIFYTSEHLSPGLAPWLNGARGVDIFFVISGFVMVVSSQRLMQAANGWMVFAKKRIHRIVPLYWLATTLKVLPLLYGAGFALLAHLDWQLILKSYLFLPARAPDGSLMPPLVGVGWTLVFEMFFYAVFAIALATRRGVYPVVATMLGACWLGSFFRPVHYPPWMAYLNPIVVEFFMGMLIAELHLRGRLLRPALAWPCLALGFAYTLLSPGNLGLSRLLENGVPAAMIVAATVSLEPVLKGRIPTWILFLGNASYAIYLFHPMTARAVPNMLMKFGIHTTALSVAACWIVGVATGCLVHRFVEPWLGFDRKSGVAGSIAPAEGARPLTS